MADKIALVAGINRYPPGLNSLTNARADAQAIADLLASDFGFTLVVLLDDAATLPALQDAIRTALASDAG